MEIINPNFEYCQGLQKNYRKIFEKIVGENQAAGLSKNSAYNAARQEKNISLKNLKKLLKKQKAEKSSSVKTLIRICYESKT